MRKHLSVALFFILALFLVLTSLMVGFSVSASLRQVTLYSAAGGTTGPELGSYEYAAGTNLTATATPNPDYSFKYWIAGGQKTNENSIIVQMTKDHTLQPVSTNSQDSSGQSDQGNNLNIPANFILIGAAAFIACCCVCYLVPLGLAMRKSGVPANIKKPRIILALISILIIVGPLGATLLVYSGNLTGMFTPSNVDKLNNMFSNQGGTMTPNVTGSWFNAASRTFGVQFNFTNPTATDLTLVAFSANLSDHSDGYSLGQLSLVNPITARANKTVTFQVTDVLTLETVAHIETAHAGTNSLDVDISNINMNFAGILLHINETSTFNNVSIVR